MQEKYLLMTSLSNKLMKDYDSGCIQLTRERMFYYRKDLETILGSKNQEGKLQKELNETFNSILIDLQTDFPTFTKRDILIFSHTVIGLPHFLISKLVGLNSPKSVWAIKSHIQTTIATKNTARKEEYLLLLSKEGLLRSGRNIIFA